MASLPTTYGIPLSWIRLHNSIKSLTEHWKFGWAGDTKKVSPDLLKKYGKDVRRMVKGRVDTSDIFKEPIQLSGKGIDWYEDLSKLSW